MTNTFNVIALGRGEDPEPTSEGVTAVTTQNLTEVQVDSAPVVVSSNFFGALSRRTNAKFKRGKELRKGCFN